MPNACASNPPLTDQEVTAILASAPIPFDAHRVSPADGDFRQVVTVASGWPSPDCRSFGLRPDRWQAHSLLLPVQVLDPDFEVGGCVDLEGWSRPVQGLIRQIPEEVREALRPYESPQQWYLLRVLARVPEFLSLMLEAPALAGLLATKLFPLGDAVPEGLERLEPLLHGPRRRLLDLLEVPEARWIVRALQKMNRDLDALIEPGPTTIEGLLRADHSFIRKRLQHLPRLRGDTLKVLADKQTWSMTTFALLADDDPDPIWDETSLHDVLIELLVARDDGRAPKKPARFKSRKQALHAWMSITPWDPMEQFPDAFGAPTDEVTLRLRNEPVLTLTPLRSASEVLEHGQRQLSCLATKKEYYEDAAAGHVALYAVSWQLPGDGEEQVATLSLRLRWDATWELEQLLRRENDPVPEWLFLRVADWVKEINALDDDANTVPPAWLTAQGEDEGVEQLMLPFARRATSPNEMRNWV